MSVSVDLALHGHPTLANFELSTRTISRFLGPPPNLLLSEVCELGTIALLDWIWSSSCTNPIDRTSSWSFTNYLRSDPHYYRWQFSKSLYAAATRGDLAMVEWLFAHFDGCEAPEEVVEAAANGGHLRVLYHLWGHRSRDEENSENSDASLGTSGTCTVKFSYQHHGGNWGEYVIKKALKNGQLVECLNSGLQLERWDRQLAIEHTVNIRQDELAEKLVPEGKSVFDYTYECPRPEIIREMMESGRFLWCEAQAALALSNAAKRGNVELLQDIFQLHSPLREDHTLWKRKWQDALKNSCSHGNLEALQWLLEHSLARDLREEMKLNPLHSVRIKLFQTAVEGGHVEVMQYLFDEGIVHTFEHITHAAVQEDKLDALKWLAKHIWTDHPEHFNGATYDAACYGRLEMLKFLHTLEHSQQYEVTGNK